MITERRGWHDRLVAKASRAWNGRISDLALRHLLRSLEYRGLQLVWVISMLVLFAVSTQLGAGPYAYVFVALVIPGVVACSALAFRHLKAASLDVARSLGLPDARWKKVRMRSPQAFDQWKASITGQSAWPWST